MKPGIRPIPILLIMCCIMAMSAGCTTDQQPDVQPTVTVEPTATGTEDTYSTVLDPGTLESRIAAYPTGTLSAEEESDILFMQEEEKLARDVYAVFHETWGMQVFNNIGDAEQTHMDSMTVLVERYGLTPPSGDGAPGVFANSDLQALYDGLIESGTGSREDALRAAALVEETDIVDLQDALSRTDKADIRYVYENLMRGSENHLRAFVRNLEQLGESYTPMVLTGDEYDEIVSTPSRPGGYP